MVFFLYFFSFVLIVMPICALSFAHGHPPTLSLSLSLFFGHRVSQEFLVKLDGEWGRGCCSRQPETSSSNTTYKSFVRLVWLGQLLLLLSRSPTLLLPAARSACLCRQFSLLLLFFLNVLFFLHSNSHILTFLNAFKLSSTRWLSREVAAH